MDKFIETIRGILNSLTMDNLAKQSIEIINLTNMSQCKMNSVIDKLFQILLQLSSNSQYSLVFPLIKHICTQNNNGPNDNQYFRDTLRTKSLQILDVILNSNVDIPSKVTPIDLWNEDTVNSIDKQTNLIEQIQYYCAAYRSRRMIHFIGHLYSIDLISLVDIYDITQQYPQFAPDMLGKKHNIVNCCDMKLPLDMENEKYKSVADIEDNLFWVQINVM